MPLWHPPAPHFEVIPPHSRIYCYLLAPCCRSTTKLPRGPQILCVPCRSLTRRHHSSIYIDGRGYGTELRKYWRVLQFSWFAGVPRLAVLFLHHQHHPYTCLTRSRTAAYCRSGSRRQFRMTAQSLSLAPRLVNSRRHMCLLHAMPQRRVIHRAARHSSPLVTCHVTLFIYSGAVCLTVLPR